jgi:hypothetical protein
VRSNNGNFNEVVGPTKIWKILFQLDKYYFERKLYCQIYFVEYITKSARQFLCTCRPIYTFYTMDEKQDITQPAIKLIF